MKTVHTSVDAPDDLGIAVIGVPPSSPVELNLRLESVVEGVLVTGTAHVALRGECVRCLDVVADSMTVDLQELYVYPGSEASAEEASRLEGDLIDLEPLFRDEVVLALPFQPVCRVDCRGLCPACGINLNRDPDHGHGEGSDPRWGVLASWSSDARPDLN